MIKASTLAEERPRSDANTKPSTIRPEISKIIAELQFLSLPALPVAPGHKNPSFINSAGEIENIKHSEYHDRMPTEDELREWFSHADVGIGALGSIRYRWLDLDAKHFDSPDKCEAAFKELIPNYENYWVERTQSGGCRVLVDCGDNPPDFTNFSLSPDGEHVGELIGVGRFAVLAPTVGQNGRYEKITDSYEPILFDELEIYQYSGKTGKSKQIDNVKSSNLVDLDNQNNEPEKLISHASINISGNSRVVPLIEIISENAKKVIAGVDISNDRSGSLAALLNELVGWQNFCHRHGIPHSNDLSYLAHEAGSKLGIDSDRINRIIKTIDPSCMPSCHYQGGDDACWTKLNKYGYYPKLYDDASPTSTRSNSSELAKNYAEIEYALSGRLRYNELKSAIELDGQLFEEDSARLWLANTLGVTLSQSDAWNSITSIAKNNSYHPVQEYFNLLATEDIDPDQVINGLAVKLFGVVDPIYYIYLKRWLIGVVARVFDPGCKMDTILILQGKEGLGKSMLFAKMCKYPEWFCDDMGSIKDKDQLLKMHHALITEWSEADSLLAKNDSSSMKAFVSCREDNIRKPYARESKLYKRRGVIVGTTNRSDFLGDEATGDRRFWVIPIEKPIDLEFVRANRDLIWAAAVKFYRQGEQWWLTSEEQQLSHEFNSGYRAVHPWLHEVDKFVADKTELTQSDLDRCLKRIKEETGTHTPQDVKAIRKCIRNLGFSSKNRRVDGKQQTVWVKEVEP